MGVPCNYAKNSKYASHTYGTSEYARRKKKSCSVKNAKRYQRISKKKAVYEKNNKRAIVLTL